MHRTWDSTRGLSERGTKTVVPENRLMCPESAAVMETNPIFLLNAKGVLSEILLQDCQWLSNTICFICPAHSV